MSPEPPRNSPEPSNPNPPRKSPHTPLAAPTVVRLRPRTTIPRPLAMRFQNVRLESYGTDLSPRVVTSLELEERLAPVYAALRLHPGRIELASGIRERRFYEPGEKPSAIAARAGARALEASGVGRDRIGCLIHASVCRDFMEPATASVVHSALELPGSCSAFDLSNACLGFANALTVVASMIEREEIEAGLVVAGEDGRPLVDTTIAELLSRERVSRDELKAAYASLTIGSGGAAFVLAHERVATSGTKLLGGLSRAATEHHGLCQGDRSDGRDGPLMNTDSERLLHAGNALAERTFGEFLDELGWTRASIDRVVTHQVGSAHRRLLFETLELDPARDFPTVETLGNMGSVSLPLSFAEAHRAGFLERGERVALLGIGSGLQCLMLGFELARS